MTAQTPIFRDSEADLSHRAKWWTSRIVIYGVLILWAFICLFPIYWTLTTSFKLAPDVMQGNMVPYVDFQPKWKGWEAIGLSPNTLGQESTVRAEFLKRFWNSTIIALTSSALAVLLGSLAAYGLSRFTYKFGFMKNDDISFFFLSQLILPPVVLALPFLVLYKELALRTSSPPSRPSWKRPRWSMGWASGGRSSRSSCPSRCPAWWPPSSCRWS